MHGILVQLPLPPQVDSQKVLNAVDPAKDVDGFHPMNAGRLATGLPALTPCTPLGCVMLAKTVHASLAGMEAVVVGRSNIVGKPLIQLLLNENATVTVAHSKTRDLPAVTRRADVVFAAVGRPEMVRGDWIKPGATVIDVGINRVAGRGRQKPHRRRCRVRRSRGGRGRDHAGAGRRRADDDRVPAGEHAARGLRDSRIARAGGLAMKTAALAIAFALLAAPAAAQSIEYVYTKFDAKTCKHTKGKAEEDYGSWLCPGLQEPARAAERRRPAHVRHLRQLEEGRPRVVADLSRASTTSTKARSSGASRSAPTARNAPVRHHPALEPRHRRGQREGHRPDQATGRVLVVTRLGPGGVCHVGYVDARANPDANELARKIADEHARSLQVRQGQADCLGKAGGRRHAAGRELSSASRTRPYRGSSARSVRMSARPRGRRAPCRIRPPVRCRSAPRSPGSSARSAPGRAAPP